MIRLKMQPAGHTRIYTTLTDATADFVNSQQPASARPVNAAYIASWLQLLNHEPPAIFTAASKAQAAADWIRMQQPR